MKPQLRPVARLHPSMLKSSSHWCFLALGNAIVASSVDILMLDSNHSAALLVRQGTVDVRIHDGDSVYPCSLQQDGSVEPECWPIEKGEEEIVGWRGVSPSRVPFKWKRAWIISDGMDNESAPLRDGMRPAPRKGDKGIVWVWEKVQ